MFRRLASRLHRLAQFHVHRIGLRPLHFTPKEVATVPWSLGWDEEPAIKAAVRRVGSHTMTSWERLASLW